MRMFELDFVTPNGTLVTISRLFSEDVIAATIEDCTTGFQNWDFVGKREMEI